MLAEGGDAEKVVVGMGVRGEIGMWVHFSFSSHVGDFSVFDGFCGDDAILGLLHFHFCLVELCLREGAFLNGGELFLTPGEELELAGLCLVRRQVRVEVSSKDYPVLGQALLEKEEIGPELLYLDGIYCAFGAEVDADEDIVIGH